MEAVQALHTPRFAMNLSNVLVVDDDRMMVALLEEQLRSKGHNVISATHGREALDLLRLHAARVDAVLLDRMMPGIDGLEIVRMMKQDKSLRNIPVVMLTGSDRPEQVREGIDAGVFYYLTKPVQESVLNSVLSAALRDSGQRKLMQQQLSRQGQAFHLIDTCRFHARTLPEAEALAVFLSHCFPDPERCLSGLIELIVNAIEHGNLLIGYDEKTKLLEEGTWRSEVMRRCDLPQHIDKQVEVLLQNRPEGTFVQVTDQGPGFDWRSYLSIDPSRATDSHGRGIAQANAQCFDKLVYNDKGNQVTVAVFAGKHRSQVLEW